MSAPSSVSTQAGAGMPWLPLLRRLTELEPSWCVWKNADHAIMARGDVDSAAPRVAWRTIADEFRRWAADTHAGPVILCEHAPGTLVLVACAPDDRARLLQLDVYERVGRVVAAEELAPIARDDGRGFRCLTPGAEGLLLLLAGARRAGLPPAQAALLPHVATLLRSDPAGVEAAAGLLGSGRRAALAGARAVAEGGWSYPAMAALEPLYLLRAARRPQERLRWLRFRFGSARRCALLAALAADRTIPGDVDAWLAAVSSNHVVNSV